MNEKKEPELQPVTVLAGDPSHPEEVEVDIHNVEEAEVDERWSLVGKNEQQRWLWHAIDHMSGGVLADVCGTHEEEVFLQLTEY